MAGSFYVGKVAQVKATGAQVLVKYDNYSGGLYVEFLTVEPARRTWFRLTDLENFHVA